MLAGDALIVTSKHSALTAPGTEEIEPSVEITHVNILLCHSDFHAHDIEPRVLRWVPWGDAYVLISGFSAQSPKPLNPCNLLMSIFRRNLSAIA
jgi:hypothetical protein